MSMYSAKIKGAKKEYSLPDNSYYSDVSIDILKDGEIVAERKFAFPLDMTEEAIIAEVKKYLVMFENDHKLAADAMAKAEVEAKAEGVLNNLKGIEI